MFRILLLLIPVALVFFPYYYIYMRPPPPLPNMDLNAWWGPNTLRTENDTEIRPFEIHFNSDMVQDLKQRLINHRPWTPPLEGAGHSYGFNTDDINDWLHYWAEKYPFQERVKFLNKYPHYKTNIQGLSIHYIRVKPEVPENVEVIPMLLMHGWPGSVREFYEIIPLLTAVSQDRDFAVELIIPSFPGFGFSDAAVRPGLGPAEIAIVLRNLMHRIGYKQYYLQGGNWGAMIGTHLATLFPGEILGFHNSSPYVSSSHIHALTLVGAIFPSLVVEPHLSELIYPLKDTLKWLLRESGYLHIQATKPDTVGIGLQDSPAGLLAYIFEKFATFTRHEPVPMNELRFTKEQLIDNLMIYWSTNSIGTSIRLYSEFFNRKQYELYLPEIPIDVPTWLFQAKYDYVFQPASVLKLKYRNLINTTYFDDGGIFMALELPDILADDILKAVTEFRRLKRNVKTEL